MPLLLSFVLLDLENDLFVKTMLERSIESLDIVDSDQLIIISQKKHDLENILGLKIKADWIEIENPTGGQLATFLAGSEIIKNDRIVIFNCDTYFLAPKLKKQIILDDSIGIIPCSKEPGESWSFCKVDQDNNIIQVTEKKRISDWASVGYYYFLGKELLIKLALEEIEGTSGKESYVAPLYEKYIKLGHKLKMVEVEKFLPFGTIEQVKDYWGVTLEELISQNR